MTTDDIDAVIAGLTEAQRRTLERCSMDVGCDEYGVCYADAHGQPDQCPRIDSIIAVLTETQRNGILHSKPHGFGAWILPLGTARGLTALGLAQRSIDGMLLTQSGLALRAHLQKQEPQTTPTSARR